jgi:hypothetical protein
MKHYLIVANQTLLGDHLLHEVRARLDDGPCDFFVLVPASHPRGTWTWTEANDRSEASTRLALALIALRMERAAVEGEIGDASPLEAIADHLRAHQVDEIILSTLPPGLSRWLKQDLPARVRARFAVSVTHVVGPGAEHAAFAAAS